MNGKGELTYSYSQTVYKGDFKDNQATGQGEKFFKDGERCEGEFLEGELNGFGICYENDGKLFRKGLWHYGFPINDNRDEKPL